MIALYSSAQVSRCSGFLFRILCFVSYRIINAVKSSGVLKERLFNAAYNSKRQAVMNGMPFDSFVLVNNLFLNTHSFISDCQVENHHLCGIGWYSIR